MTSKRTVHLALAIEPAVNYCDRGNGQRTDEIDNVTCDACLGAFTSWTRWLR